MIGTGTFTLYIFKDELAQNNEKIGLYLIPIFSLVFYYFSFKIITTYLKKGRKIILDSNTFNYGKESYNWSEIHSIILTGKNNFSFLSNGVKESTTIILKNGQKYIIYDFLYSNISEIKSFIQYNVLNNKKPKSEIVFEDTDYIELKGNYFLNISTIMCWGFPIFFSILFLFDNRLNQIGLLIFSIFSLLWFVFYSSWLNYFKCSKTHLEIKNYHFIWLNKKIQLSDIYKVIFESPYKKPYTLKIVLKDFKVATFPADSLKDKDWQILKANLQENGIKVTDEIS
jgi:hypothetical protein